jgi:putative sterol carrier protein
MSTSAAQLRYLSLEWIDALTAAVAADPVLAELAGAHRIGLTQVITEGPEGTVIYHLQLGDGSARFGAGPADPEDVRLDQSWETAVAVATAQLNAEEAFVSGRIRLVGDVMVLQASMPVFAALDAVFTAIRDRTEYS